MNIAIQRTIFIRFLDRNYCITAHLTERLDELRESVLFLQLHEHISTAISMLEAQSLNADQLYLFLGANASFATNGPLISFLENTFSCLPNKDDGTQYACLLDYVSIANALMAESARLADIHMPGLSLPDRFPYQAIVLEPLMSALAQVGLVSW